MTVEQNLLETMLEMLRMSTVPQLLFDGETLLALSPTAEPLFPTAEAGDQASVIFGDEAVLLQRFQGGSILFPVETILGTYHVTLAEVQGLRLATLHPDGEGLSTRAALSVAERLRHSLGTVMSLTPKLLPQLEAQLDTQIIERASELNKSIYSMLRITESLECWGAENLLLSMARDDLDRWLEEQVKKLAPLCAMADRSLIYLSAKERCFCSFNPEQLRVALEHLISNAIKFSSAGGEITLSLRPSGRRYIITVRDQGCGIPTAQLGQVFSRSENRGAIPDPRWGVGLGLPVVKRIVQAHGGRVMLESTEGKGTAVHLALPAMDENSLPLRSEMMIPISWAGIDPSLVGLSDVLPARAYDPRGVDL